MEFLRPPKLLNWERQLRQEYTCDQSLLITSGCSFTASTTQLESAASWPGYVKDRCGFKSCIDMSYPGVGNRYIKDSVINAVEQCRHPEDVLIIVMWSGLDRVESLVNGAGQPTLNGVSYQRIDSELDTQQLIDQNAEYILDLSEYLNNNGIQYAFTTYINLLHEPYIPVRDTTPRLTDYHNQDKIKQVSNKINFPKTGSDYLYEWAFLNNYLNFGDRYHPPVEANLKWTDSVLLPNLKQLGIIE